ncbi:MAG: transcription-repair coupling factor [Bacteroidales bacterium]
MTIKEFFAKYKKNSSIVAFSAMLKENKQEHFYIEGLTGSASSVMLASLQGEWDAPLLFVLNDEEEAGYMYHDLLQLIGEEKLLFFPSSYKRAIKYAQMDPANAILRTEVAARVQAQEKHMAIVTYPEALAEKVVSQQTLSKNTIRIAAGEEIESSFVADTLYEYGFERVDYVYEPGQYAVRGSILDVYSFSHEYPYRIDFFGNEIESIRTFDIESQLSRDRIGEISIVSNLNTKEGSGITFLEFLPSATQLLIKNLSFVAEKVTSIVDEGISEQAMLSDDYDAGVKGKLVDPVQFKKELLNLRRIEFGTHSFAHDKTAKVTVHTTPQPIFHKNFDLVMRTFKDYLTQGYEIALLTDSVKQGERLHAIFQEKGEKLSFDTVLNTLHEGFVDKDHKVCFFTDHQIFDRFHKYNLKSDKARSGKLALSLKELMQFEIGDYVVHIDHGVGKFGGLVRSEQNGRMQEMIKLIYLNDDIIFVSIHALHKLSKYRGKEGEPPRVNKLGSGAWEKMKEKTKSKVKDIARDLIKLYAQRKQEKGYSYSPDGYMQQELEASFIYEDTPDQLKSTAEVKKDMEGERPMDRLICGDVGFGKTEVAIRAAFKAATDGKQVAVLVPTTVLAYQHYKSFSERLKDFPVKIDYLSRARKAGDVRKLLQGLKEGTPEIVIGTHKLIGKDVQFKDLGLLIIDEEQKFGVSVKEKLRQIRTNVDTLTMTATPIPRTLQFSLLGARDLSVIQTPPPNRYPIRTEVHTFNEDILKEAINFELSRNGQVFFINNRIQSLFEIAETIRKIVPDARVRVGHGQMKPEELEQTIIDFQNYEFDVLIATTIVESGIDIPNANTIIINNAQNFGLSDLQQMRGRVGRSNRKAFCYLIAPPLHQLSQESRRRLQAIENFSDLGSGIHIAMQDLDIRGAGNMLGAEQSGFIADLGYETYQKILQEAVHELRVDEFSDLYEDEKSESETNLTYVSDCVVESDLELLFPSDYIPSDTERISLYRDLDSMENERDIDIFVKQLEDRFGKIPVSGKELIRVVRLRRLAKRLGMEKIILKNSKMIIHFVSNLDSAYYQSAAFGGVLNYMANNPRYCQIKESKGKRSMTISHISSVENAVDILNQIVLSLEEEQ